MNTPATISSSHGLSTGAIGSIVAGAVIVTIVAIGSVLYYKLLKLRSNRSSSRTPQAYPENLEMDERMNTDTAVLDYSEVSANNTSRDNEAAPLTEEMAQ
jgi:hypothetical protein